MTSKELRSSFLDFFRRKGHLVLKSFSLIPDDPSTLFTSAGMQPLTPYFKGESTPPSRRIATCQKCLRTGDIERIGYTWRHLSFFEMLGNFSFGDYFKREAILWAWEFLVDVLKIDSDRLWVSVYFEDDEAFSIWERDVGLKEERIVRLGKEDNFWGPVGDEGPCGPCTEIHYDRGERYGCGREDCKVGCDCDRFGELWNLVFQQYDMQKDGTLLPLPKVGIDTGMGLERLTAVMQGKETVFETDLFMPAVEATLGMLKGYSYGSDREKDAAIRVIADHMRAALFAIADGVMPSNEGRGYVLRRLIRRAHIYGRKLSLEGAFAYKLISVFSELMRDVYEEVGRQAKLAEEIVRREEERFIETMGRSMRVLEEIIERHSASNEKAISGEEAFMLYDTYGLPIELTCEIAHSRGFSVDVDGFKEALERQRELARVRSAFKVEDVEGFEGMEKTQFVGYEETEVRATVVAVREIDGELFVVLDRTPFYAEAGGQVADTGWLKDDDGNVLAEVLDARWFGDVIAHKVKAVHEKLAEGESVWAIVDEGRRVAIMRAHTATHILHAALRNILGEHVRQAGSLVAPDRLRFDFTHPQPLTEEEIEKVERWVNEVVLKDIPVQVFETSFEEAKAMGAIALFGEKYGERVRVVRIGDVSMELCGGTHLRHTSQVGTFRVVSETSVAANIRRIEALTGFEALELALKQGATLRSVCELLGAQPERLKEAMQALLEERRKLQKRIEQLEAKTALTQVEELMKRAITVDGIKLVTAHVPNISETALGQLADAIVAKMPQCVVVLASTIEGKISFVAKVSSEAQAMGVHAGKLIGEVARITGGGGGGRADFAQAGGKDISKLAEALSKAKEILLKQLGRK
jgi:alanyl-tRNA synthetase